MTTLELTSELETLITNYGLRAVTMAFSGAIRRRAEAWRERTRQPNSHIAAVLDRVARDVEITIND